jgi:short-subunit dehydrogenase
MRRLEGRVAVITGAGSGIGRALAHALAERGCRLALADWNATALEETAAALREKGVLLTTHVVDVADRAAMEKLARDVIELHENCHILVNNAGVAIDGTIEEVSFDDFAWVVGVNFWGVVHGCKVFLPHLKRADEAHIVNVSSVFGLIGVPRNGPYCATKFAVRGFSEALWTELRGTRVGVTCVHPGGVQTNIVRNARLRDESERSAAIAEFARAARMSPEDAARRIVAAIERNAFRLRLGPETYAGDWMKRLFPRGTQQIVGWLARRAEKRLRPGSEATPSS